MRRCLNIYDFECFEEPVNAHSLICFQEKIKYPRSFFEKEPYKFRLHDIVFEQNHVESRIRDFHISKDDKVNIFNAKIRQITE